MKTDVYDLTGKVVRQLTLPKEIFGQKADPKLLAQAVRVYLANQRGGHAKTKTRGEVTGSRAKIYRQKGTGRARHGDRKAPLFVGGGIAHGPTGTQRYASSLSRRMRRKALAGALSDCCRTGKMRVVDLAPIKPRTKLLTALLTKLNLTDKHHQIRQKVLLVTGGQLPNVRLAARNISRLTVVPASTVHTYLVLNSPAVLMLPESIEELKKGWGI